MDIYDEIDIIDDFQERFGLRQSVRRACDLIVSILAGYKNLYQRPRRKGLTLQSNARKVLLFTTKWRLRECR
jgi:hypothetical protein